MLWIQLSHLKHVLTHVILSILQKISFAYENFGINQWPVKSREDGIPSILPFCTHLLLIIIIFVVETVFYLYSVECCCFRDYDSMRRYYDVSPQLHYHSETKITTLGDWWICSIFKYIQIRARVDVKMCVKCYHL